MIICRIVQHNRKMRKLGHEFTKSLYSGIISMFIESAILILGVSLLLMVLLFIDEDLLIYPLYLLPHVSVISPLLIIFRVAQGRAFIYGQGAQEIRSDIRFHDSDQS